MDDAKLAVNVFLEQGLKRRELDNVLASNSVVDWFGRTIKGRQNIVNFFLNSNVIYEHRFSSVETTQAFEDRNSHMTTRQMPPENRPGSAEIAPKDYNATPSWEKGADCTPTNKSTFMITCPPAPNRNLCSTLLRSESSSSDESRDSDDCDLSGIRPIDTGMRVGANESPMRSPKTKKRRLDNSIVHEELNDDSTHSNLKYLKTVGTVASNRQDPEKIPDERGCIVYLSYRQRRDNPKDVQISLIVYKPNAKNVKSRRNLLSEFGETSSTVTDGPSQSPIGKSAKTMLTTPSKSGGKNGHIRPSPSSSKKRQVNTLRF